MKFICRCHGRLLNAFCTACAIAMRKNWNGNDKSDWAMQIENDPALALVICQQKLVALKTKQGCLERELVERLEENQRLQAQLEARHVNG